MTLQEFKAELENYGNERLKDLDEKIAKLEEKLTGLEFRDKIFKFKKRLARVEKAKFGFSLDTDDDGKEN